MSDVVLPGLDQPRVRLLVQPIFQQRIATILRLHASRRGSRQDGLTFSLLDLPVSPGNTDERHNRHGRKCFGLDVQFDKTVLHRLVMYAGHLGQLGATIRSLQTFAKDIQELLIAFMKEDVQERLRSSKGSVGHDSASFPVEGLIVHHQFLPGSRCGVLLGVFHDNFVDRQAHTAQLRPQGDFAESQDLGGPVTAAADFLQDPEDDQAVQLFP